MARWSTHAGSRAIAVALLVCAVSVAGCAPVAADGEDAGSQQTQPSPSPAPPLPGPVGPVAPDEPSEPDPVLSWVPPGPASPGDPPEQSWYLLLRDRACADLTARVGTNSAGTDDASLALWAAAATTCTAMATGEAATWSDAESQVHALGAPSDDESKCFASAVLRALLRAVDFHTDHPEIRQIASAPADGIACKETFVDVRPQDPSGQPGGCDSRWHVLDGRLLPSTVIALIRADESRQSLGVTIGEREHLYVEMPPGEEGQVVTISASTSQNEPIAAVDYEYPPIAPECIPPAPDLSPSPTE